MWALTNVELLDGIGLHIQRGGLLIDDSGIIRAIEANYIPNAGIPVIDGHGLLCLPGFIDAHSHIGLSTSGETLGSQDVNETSDPVTADLRALDGIYPKDPAILEALKAGITASYVTMGSANVISGIGTTVHMAGDTVEEMVMVPAAGMKVAMGENPIRVHGGQKRRPSSRPAVAAVLREWLEKARRYQLDTARNLKDWDPRLEALGMVIRGDIPLRVHSHRSDDIATAHRVISEFKVRMVIDHGTEADLLSEQILGWGVPVVTGPSFSTRGKAELRHKGFWTPARLIQKGIVTAIASDHPVVPAEYLPLYAGLAMRHGIDLSQALASITIAPAQITGVSGRVGALRVGLEADLVLFEGNPLVSLQAKAKHVWITGKTVYQA